MKLGDLGGIFALCIITLLFNAAIPARAASSDPYDIDLTPDSTAVETVSRNQTSNAPSNPSPISTVVQNLNPDISFVGDFLAGNAQALYLPDDKIHRPIYMREVEIDGVGYVSPYAKALFVASFGESEAGVEEGFMNFFNLPGNLNLKLGKMLVDTDTLNPLHQHAIPFVDRPLALHHAFGLEGLKTVGANLSVIVPNPWDHYVMVSGTFGANNGDESNLSALYGGNTRSTLSNVRATTSWDFGQYLYLNLNASALFAPMPDGSTTHAYLADVMFRFVRDPVSNAITFLNGFVWTRGDPYQTGAFATHGFYNYLGWQFTPRWRAGARYDYTDHPAYSGEEKQYTGILSFYPTETNYLRLQYARHQGPATAGGAQVWDDKVWLQLDFTIGPHQQHTAL